MSSFKPYLLSCAVAFFSLPVMATDSYNSFTSDAKIDGKVQTVYFNDENTTKNETEGAWTGAIWLNARTGYFADVVSIGGSAYRVARLEMKDGNSGSSELLNDSREGFGKLGQAWVDVKLPESYDGLSADVKIGRQLLETGLVTVSDSRSIPSAWQGVNASVEMDDFNGKIAWLNEVSKRNQSGFHDIKNSTGEKIDWVMGMELGYTFELENQRRLKLQYRNGLADNYVNAHNGNIWFTMPLYNDSELTLSGMYFYAKQDGDLWNWTPKKLPFKDNAESTNLSITVFNGPWTINAAFNYTKADTKNPETIGRFSYEFGDNSVWDVPTAANVSDFNFHKEKAWLIGAEYDFSHVGLKGLTLGYNFFYGSGMKDKNGSDVNESEHDINIKYNFGHWGMQDLQFKLEYGYYKNDAGFREATGQDEAENLRAWLSYSFSI